MSNLPFDPDETIRQLYAEGADFVLQQGHLVVRRIPYISPDGVREDGKLVLPVKDDGGTICDAIGNHTIWFVGDEPRDETGIALGTLMNPGREISGGDIAKYQLSFKPPSTGTYPSVYDKIRTYVRVLSSPARSLEPAVRPYPGAAFQVVEDGLPFVYRDTNTTRAGLTGLNNLFRGHTVAIVGLGGTGSYILDQVAKTWVDRIILVDGDSFQNHNAFRAPGAAALYALQAEWNKADYFAAEYSRMHTGISTVPEYLTLTNIRCIEGATFVFLAAADAAERPAIMAWLHDRGVPFIDVGMGLSQAEAGLTGLLKVTAYLSGNHIGLPTRPAAPPGQDDYASNIQVADLNALNGLLAVIRWKRHLGYYASESMCDETIFKLYSNEIRNGNIE